MNIEINHISKRVVEVEIDEINSGLLNKEEAKELALQLINVAAELLQVEK